MMMSDQTIDNFARLAARLPAGARSATQSKSVTASAKASKKAKQKCQHQVPECEALVTSSCAGDQACLDAKLGCCTFLSACHFDGFLVCFSG
jgi:hypothetical protein